MFKRKDKPIIQGWAWTLGFVLLINSGIGFLFFVMFITFKLSMWSFSS